MSQDFRDALSAQEIFSLQKSNFCILTIRSAIDGSTFTLMKVREMLNEKLE